MGLTRQSVGWRSHLQPKNKESSQNNKRVIAFAGNPNVGKSTIFNRLTGQNQHTGNWPGKTVALAEGNCALAGGELTLVDLPGCYSLLPHSAEEAVARAFVCSPTCQGVVVVCDATALERNLTLALQILSVHDRVLVCVNLLDEAKRTGIKVDLPALSRELRVPVLGMAAGRGQGFEELTELMQTYFLQAAPGAPYPDCDPDGSEDATIDWVRQAERIAARVQSRSDSESSGTEKIDRLLTGRLTALPAMILLLLLVFWLTLTGANYLSAALDWLFSYLAFGLERILSGLQLPGIVQDFILNGLFQVTAAVVAVMLPPMAIFFPLFTLLEDLGYLPRVAFNLDRYFKCCHACGKQSLTMCMGLGCNAAGVIGCRIIDSERERLIAMLTNSFVPCNGRLPLLITLISLFFIGDLAGWWSSVAASLLLLAIIMLGVALTLLASWFLSKTVLKGLPSAFVLELPPYRRPQVKQVILRSVKDRTLFVLGRAVCTAMPAGALIWFLNYFTIDGLPLLSYCANFLNLPAGFLGLDGVILLAFILAFPANELVLPLVLVGYLASGDIAGLQIWAACRRSCLIRAGLCLRLCV